MNNTNPIYLIKEGRILTKALDSNLLSPSKLSPELFKRGSQLRKDVASRARSLMKDSYHGGRMRDTVKNLTRSGAKPSNTQTGREAMKWLKSKSGGDQRHILAKAIDG